MAPIRNRADQITSREKALVEQLNFQKKLNFITNKIHSSQDTNDILINRQNTILSLFDADRITIYTVDGAKRQIVSKFKTGDEVNEIRVPINNSSISGFCAASGKVINVKNAYDDKELKALHRDLRFDKSWDMKTGYRTKQVLVAPIAYNNYLLGVGQIINKKNGINFSLKDQASFLEITRVLGIAFFNNERAQRKARPTKFADLINSSIISKNDVERAMATARKVKKQVESVLISDFHVSKADIGKSLSNYYDTKFIPYDERMVIPGDLLTGLRPSFLKNNIFVPISHSGNKVVVAMENPDYLPARDAIRRLIKAQDFVYCVALREDIFKIIDMFFDVGRSDMMGEMGSIEDILGQLGASEDEQDDDLERVSEEDGAVVQLVNKMIIDAYNRNASDIHIEPRMGKANSVIRFRIDGACQVYQTFPYTFKRAIVSRLKIMSDLDIAEKRLPQDGKIKFDRYAPLDIELRVATIPTTGANEDVVMRILPAGEPMPLDKMGMSDRNNTVFKEMITKPYGIVLVVGPTGSGKTTTLHAALHHINKPETKIWTAEDPVEITQEGLRQVQVAPKIGFDFAAAMRSFLRADPDVIMVGEMRDHETVSIGIEASLTGHLVFSTLHTNSAPETITRLLDMGMDPFNFADAILGVLAQRLVRTFCKDCKEKHHPTMEEFDGLRRAYAGDFDSLGYTYNDDLTLHKAKGCDKCGKTGYRGRTGLHEILVGTDTMKRLIQGRAKMEQLREQAKKDGMTTLLQDGIRKTLLGETDLLQVRKVCIQ